MKTPSPYFGNYIEPGYSPQPIYVVDEIYSQILDAIVLACVDIVLLHEGKLLLGKRAWHPQADWWIIGGRINPGEELEATAARHVKRDLALDLKPDRFNYLSTISAAWRMRRHAPVEHGIHTVSIVMSAKLTPSEVPTIHLNEEYTQMRWFSQSDIISNTDLHPALHQCARALREMTTN